MSKILTYDDLMQEKIELEAQLLVQRERIREDLDHLKAELKPATDLLSFMGKITTRDSSNSLLTAGVDILSDVLIKKVLLARSSWVMRLVLPYFIKNYSTNMLSKNGASIFHVVTNKLKNAITNSTLVRK